MSFTRSHGEHQMFLPDPSIRRPPELLSVLNTPRWTKWGLPAEDSPTLKSVRMQKGVFEYMSKK